MATKRRTTIRKRSPETTSEPTAFPPSPPPHPRDSRGGEGTRFRLRGAKQRYDTHSALATTQVKLKVKGAFLAGAARADQALEEVEVAGEDLVEIEFAEGGRVWLRGDEFRARFGGAPARDVAGTELIDVPGGLDVLPTGLQARGPIQWAVKSLKVIGVDLAGMTAEKIAEGVEGRTSPKRPGLGLFSCAMVSEGFSLGPVKPDADGGAAPYLVFIHGTASSTWGSFGDLWSKDRATDLEALRAAYGERVLAFEHPSLTRSPIENALGLARELAATFPQGARLHLVTHSRGGLVGELLCRAGVAKPREPFESDEIQLFARDERHQESKRRLEELNAELNKHRFTVERFVRVACPALGTTLASGRLDRWLSVIGSIAGNALPDTPLADTLKDMGDFIAAVVNQRTEPDRLPGLEAMMPDSAFIKLANWPTVTVPGDLFVIAGDIDPDAWWARLLVWSTDRFYEGDHDLVVNTLSMHGGVKRIGRELLSFHKGPRVNHFSYFQIPESAQRLVQALTTKEDPFPEFEPLTKQRVDIPRAIAPRTAEPKPVVFLLPDIMGSELAIGDDQVWIDIPDLIFGGLARLKIDAQDVRPIGIVSLAYGALIERLAHSHKVVPFPFDWRLPVEVEADRLAQAVRVEHEAAKRNDQPVRLIAHSLGGLVARTLIARHEALWRELCAHQGARLVMLGTPNGGSHAITELLVGQSSMLRKLAFLDIRHSPTELLDIISRYPGVLAMLPKDNAENYFASQTWEHYHQQAGNGWVEPSSKDLDRAREFRRLLDGSPIDPKHMIYVAGCADITVAGMRLDPDAKRPEERIKFLATTRGDGRVTWDSGILADIPTWYMDVEHGDLADHEDSFEALEQLLEQGSTDLLPRMPPVPRTAAMLFPLPRAAEELYPGKEELTRVMLGGGARRHRRKARRARPVHVRVVHGNLAYASYPVAVGHYAGDTIISAEKHLDLALDGALTWRNQLGLYPGPDETSAVFINPKLDLDPDVKPKGAIVVGLGTVGNLSAAALTRSVTRALLEYVIEWGERGTRCGGAMPADKRNELCVTSLLIGTGAGGVPVADSVFALLQAVQRANQALETAAANGPRITELELIDLWEDRAIHALEALDGLKSQPGLENAFVFIEELETRNGGQRRVSFDEPGGWWQRLQILGGAKEGEREGTLRFAASTRRARSEVRILPTQRALVDRFIEQSIRTTRGNQTVARTLFELLLPNELKDQAPDQDDLVLILDEAAARYPWELLEDPLSPSGKPFVYERGLLRQLESTEFRETVRGATDNTALVVGDPLSSFPELKAAQTEAEAVARVLRANGLDTELRLRPTGEQVVNALFARAYRVLHLAGHGVYRQPPKQAIQCEICGQALPKEAAEHRLQSLEPVTGMIIGDNLVLSPKEVQQMRRVPEMVFINCCHLGRVEAGDMRTPIERNERNDYHKIAANLATEFIRMGVRAVVAAGWAVDDLAAATFASVFYEEMLAGKPFGKAVHSARKAAFDRHPGSNTWGAYQCYGDPDYRLVKPKDGDRQQEEVRFVSPAKAVSEIDNLAAQLATRAGVNIDAEVEWLRHAVSALEKKGWLDNGRICAALGRAFAEAKLFEEAIRYYQQAGSAEDAAVTLKDLEQFANLRIRWATRLWEQEGAKRTEEVVCQMKAGRALLDQIVQMGGATSERLSLLGSACKRLALISKTDRGDSLRGMAEYYRKAHELTEKAKKQDAYALLNWLTAEIALGWQASEKASLRDRVPKFDSLLATARSWAAAAQTSFWNEVMMADADLIAALSAEPFDAQSVEGLTAKYLEARKRGSPREFASVLDQFDFLAAMAEKKGPASKALVSLRRKLEKKSA